MFQLQKLHIIREQLLEFQMTCLYVSMFIKELFDRGAWRLNHQVTCEGIPWSTQWSMKLFI